MLPEAPGYRYLNRDGRWPDFALRGLTLGEDETLRLDHLPRLEGPAPDGLTELPAPTAPAGLAVLPDGTLFFTDPDCHRLLWLDGCADHPVPMPCTGGPSDLPGGFQHPRGVAYHPGLHALVVVDSSNHRLQLLDPETHQVRGIWGSFGDGPGQFMTPLGVAVDADGNVYVADTGNRRVQKLDVYGRVQRAFALALSRDGHRFNRPTAVAVREHDGRTEVFVLDAARKRVTVADAGGRIRDAFEDDHLGAPIGLAVVGDAVYVGDNAYLAEPGAAGGASRPARRVLRFKPTTPGDPAGGWALVGAAMGYDGPVAALATYGRGRLWVHPGASSSPDCSDEADLAAPIPLAAEGGSASAGHAWTLAPIANPSYRLDQWHRVQVFADALAAGRHLQLFVGRPSGSKARDAERADTPTIIDVAKLPTSAAPGDNLPEVWEPLPIDITEGLVAGAPAEPIWLAIAFTSEGAASPVATQMRIDFDYETLLGHLPAIYQADAPQRDFLARFLTLFESPFVEVDATLDRLPARFDPASVPAAALPWLAGWLAVDLTEDWTEARKRQAIERAFGSYAWRGTARGLRDALRQLAGVEVQIEEPLSGAAWWSLAGGADPEAVVVAGEATENSVLGFTTMLAPGSAQGAVVGTTSVLDGSHLIEGDDFGAPLFDDLAHRFTVRMYRGGAFGEHQMAEVRDMIERERPAHTSYHLCVVEPRMRLGLQSRIGVDTVVSGPPTPAPLGSADGAEGELVLGGEPAGRLGSDSRIGQTTRLDAVP